MCVNISMCVYIHVGMRFGIRRHVYMCVCGYVRISVYLCQYCFKEIYYLFFILFSFVRLIIGRITHQKDTFLVENKYIYICLDEYTFL